MSDNINGQQNDCPTLRNAPKRATGFAKASVSFSDCAPAPVGAWKGRLVSKSWGKSSNLHCFFENIDTGYQHCISAFRSKNGSRKYCPKDGEVDFSIPGIEGQNYEIQTGVNGKGNPSWFSAKEIA